MKMEECIYCKDPGQYSGPLHFKNYKTIGLTVLGITGACIATVYAVATPFILPAFRKICLPYVPATTTQVKYVLQALKSRARRGGRTIDLGSGDGRLVLEAARNGFTAVGVELNPWLVWYSQLQARRHSLHHLASFKRSDLWKVNCSQFSNIIIFGVDKMMPLLEEKFDMELPLDGCVIACRFPLPNWIPTTVIGSGIDTVWVYSHPQGKPES